MADAYRDGFIAGRADRFLGMRSEYAWHGVLDSPRSYTHHFSLGYRAAWSA